MNRPHAYGIIIKPRVLLAMLALYATAYFSSYATSPARQLDPSAFLMGFTAVTVAVSGANAMNCYLDRDIDALMVRTRGRLIALNATGVTGALGFSLLLLVIATGISYTMGVIPFTLFVVGAGFYLLFYTMLLKRRTVFNVLATAPSVAAPAWLGWHLGGAPLYPIGLILGLLVAIWGPLHLWSLAYAYSKDYKRVDVPMLPSVVSTMAAVNSILGALVLLVLSSYLLMTFSKSHAYTLGVSLVNIPLLVTGVRFWRERTNRMGYWLFKLTAPYIVLVLLTFTLDQIFF